MHTFHLLFFNEIYWIAFNNLYLILNLKEGIFWVIFLILHIRLNILDFRLFAIKWRQMQIKVILQVTYIIVVKSSSCMQCFALLCVRCTMQGACVAEVTSRSRRRRRCCCSLFICSGWHLFVLFALFALLPTNFVGQASVQHTRVPHMLPGIGQAHRSKRSWRWSCRCGWAELRLRLSRAEPQPSSAELSGQRGRA